jgi:hypothetical protein
MEEAYHTFHNNYGILEYLSNVIIIKNNFPKPDCVDLMERNTLSSS